MGLDGLPDVVIANLTLFLNQNDLINLCQCNNRFNTMGNDKLKKNLLVISPISNRRWINWNIMKTFCYDYTTISYEKFQLLYQKGIFDNKTENIAMMKSVMQKVFYNPKNGKPDGYKGYLPLKSLITLDDKIESWIDNDRLRITTFDQLNGDDKASGSDRKSIDVNKSEGNSKVKRTKLGKKNNLQQQQQQQNKHGKSDGIDTLISPFDKLQLNNDQARRSLYKLGLDCQNHSTLEVFTKLHQYPQLKCLYLYNISPTDCGRLPNLSLNQFSYRGDVNLVQFPINWQTIYELRMEIDSLEVLSTSWATHFKVLQYLYIIDQTTISAKKLYQFLENLPHNKLKSIEIRNLNLDNCYKNNDEKILIELIVDNQPNLKKFTFQSGAGGVEDMLLLKQSPMFVSRSTPYSNKARHFYNPQPDRVVHQETPLYTPIQPGNSTKNQSRNSKFKFKSKSNTNTGVPNPPSSESPPPYSESDPSKKKTKSIFHKLRNKIQK